MVFVWSQMTRGDPNYTLVQVVVRPDSSATRSSAMETSVTSIILSPLATGGLCSECLRYAELGIQGRQLWQTGMHFCACFGASHRSR